MKMNMKHRLYLVLLIILHLSKHKLKPIMQNMINLVHKLKLKTHLQSLKY